MAEQARSERFSQGALSVLSFWKGLRFSWGLISSVYIASGLGMTVSSAVRQVPTQVGRGSQESQAGIDGWMVLL